MPAQILPLLDDTSQALAMQRMQQQMEYHDQLLNLREASVQNEQNLNPLRQQIMQSEFQKNQQSLQAGQQAMTLQQQNADQQSALAPYNLQEAQNRASYTGIQATRAKNELDESVKDAPNRAQLTANQLTQQALQQQLTKAEIARSNSEVTNDGVRLKISLADQLQRNADSDLKMKLGTQQLSDDQQTMATHKAALLMTLTDQPALKRQLAVPALIQGGMLDPKNPSDADSINKILSAPEPSKDHAAMIGDVLSLDDKNRYEADLYMMQHPEDDPQKIMIAKKLGTPLPQDQAFTDAARINAAFLEELGRRKAGFAQAPAIQMDPATKKPTIGKDGGLLGPDGEPVKEGQVYRLPDPKNPSRLIPLRRGPKGTWIDPLDLRAARSKDEDD